MGFIPLMEGFFVLGFDADISYPINNCHNQSYILPVVELEYMDVEDFHNFSTFLARKLGGDSFLLLKQLHITTVLQN